MGTVHKPTQQFTGIHGSDMIGTATVDYLKRDVAAVITMFNPDGTHTNNDRGGIHKGNLMTDTNNNNDSGIITDDYLASNAVNSAKDVTTSINGKAITDILEPDGITAKQATKTLNASIAFGLSYPYSGQQTPWYSFRVARTLAKIIILCNTVPASTVITLYKNGSSIDSFTFTSQTYSYTPSGTISFAVDDYIYITVTGGVTNLTSLTVELELD